MIFKKKKLYRYNIKKVKEYPSSVHYNNYNEDNQNLINKFNKFNSKSKSILSKRVLTLMELFTYLYTCKYYYKHLYSFKKYVYDNIGLIIDIFYKHVKVLKCFFNYINKNYIN